MQEAWDEMPEPKLRMDSLHQSQAGEGGFGVVFPTPWKVVKQRYIEAANHKTFMVVEQSGFDLGLLEFIIETVNNSVETKITDVQVSCICGWQGTVSDCLLEVNDKGGLGCPECETVRKSIDTCHTYGLEYEIVLVDGNSQDGTQEWCLGRSDIRLIQHDKLLGAVKAFNDGAYTAMGQYVILANDDIEFLDNSIWLAYVYMLEHSDCGIGCFNQDRRRQHMADDHKDKYAVEHMPVVVDGKQQSWPYGQVCIVPKWLGDRVGWWGDYLHTYGGDNEISSQIYNLGFKVSPVPGTKIRDNEADDQLRTLNNISGGKDPRAVRGYHPDSAAWGDKWHNTRKNLTGPIIKPYPLIAIPPTEARMRILYLPIFEPGWAILKEQKRGLREALAKVGIVYEYDYMERFNAIGKDQMMVELIRLCQQFKPSLIVTQLHNPDMINGGDIRSLRHYATQAKFANWNGDYWPDQQLTSEALDLVSTFDVNTTVNREVIQKHQAQGINSQFWQIGWEPLGRGYEPEIYHDVVFLASGYSPKRQELGKFLKRLQFFKYSVGLYGSGWPDEWAKGSNLYNFEEACKIYRGAKFAIGDSQWPESGFVSNRVMQVLAAGNCVLTHQWFKDMDQLGLVDGETCIIWRDTDELEKKLTYYLDNESECQRIAVAGEQLALERHSFDVRVSELFAMLNIATDVVIGGNWR
jgi:glycosyltransferase involved in cell wall biosynthesis